MCHCFMPDSVSQDSGEHGMQDSGRSGQEDFLLID